MLIERLKTNFILTKLIFFTTIILVLLTVVLGIMFLTVDAQTIVSEASHFAVSFEESLSVSDEIEATLNP